MRLTKTEIARIAHETNRAYCESLGDMSVVPWEEAPQWQKETVLAGVELHLGDAEVGPEASHQSWMAKKEAEGWVYGPIKDPAKKTHPCMVPFFKLPVEQQAKDYLFRGVVRALAEID